MKNLAVILCAFFVLLSAHSISAQDDYKPWIKGERERHSKIIELSKIQYPGDTKIDVTYYGLDLTVTSSPQYLSGNVTVNANVDTTSLNTIFLDLRNALTVDSVWLNGTATTYTHASHKLNIDLDRTYTQGESVSVKVFYQGVPGSSGFGSFEFGTHGGIPIIWTLSEPYGTPDWFPCKDTPADKADSSDVWITVADNLTAVANGTLISATNNGNGTITYYWESRYPIAQYLISLAITNYQQYDTYYHYGVSDSMLISHYVYPESFNSIKTYLDATAGMIEVFSDRYGLYPFINERYGHAEMEWGGAMEHQTCSSMGFWGTGVVSHELAHQWYGDMITCADWHHIWLNEGFATYSEAVYLEARDGKAAYDSQIQGEMNYAKTANGTIWVQDITNVWEIFNGPRSYAKGATVLHMLRGIVGDSTFFDIMRTYSADPSVSYGAATTEDFQAIAESVYGSDLNYFFQEWIYGENYPKYTIGWNKSHISGDTYHITLNINQTVNSFPSYFTMPVQIKFITTLGDTTVTLFNDQQVQNFQFDIIGDPQSISFDPGNWILKTLEGIIVLPPTTFQLTVTVADGWNMLSVPGLHPTNQNVDTWWSGKDPAADVFKYNAGYVAVTTATPTEGYWMKNVGAQVYSYPAIEIVPHDPINCTGGWNLIGIYEVPVDTADMIGIIPPVYGYFGGYQTVDSLFPGYGYFVRCNGSQIIIPDVLNKQTEKIVAEYIKEDWGKIIITDNAGVSYTLYAVKGEVNLDNYELPPIPPAGMFDIRYSSGRIAEDINSSIQTIEMNSLVYPITVSVEGMDIRLQDESGKDINENVKSGGQITISNAQINKLMVSGELIPDVYALEQNYPNPFNPSTVIEFSLPEDVSNVQLTIYDILGQRITQLVNTSLKAGKYSYQWNAGTVATGMYIYELRTNSAAGGFVSVKKMILLR